MNRIIMLLCIAQIAFSGTARHVVASGGIASGTASDSLHGWTIAWAIDAGNSTRQPGDTMYLHAGLYEGRHIVAGSGSAGNPLIYRNWNGQRAMVWDNNSDLNAVWVPWQVTGNYVWAWGLDFSHGNPANGGDADLVSFQAQYGKLINCVVHDALSLGVDDFGDNARGTEVTGCVGYYNGRGPIHWNGSPYKSQPGYFAYVQNKEYAYQKVYRNNIVFSSWDLGIQFYGSDVTSMNNIKVQRNVFFNNGNLIPDEGQSTERYKPNYIMGPGEASAMAIDDDTVRANISWYSMTPTRGNNVLLGYNGPGYHRYAVDSNYFISPNGDGGYTSVTFCCGISPGSGLTSFRGNVVAGTYSGGDLASQWPTGSYGNYYYASGSYPSRSVEVRIDPNPYEPKRANITVLNWAGNSTATIDLSGILSVGDVYHLKAATNFYGPDVAGGTYTGGSVTVSASSFTMAPVFGGYNTFPPVNPAPYFLSMVLLGPQGGSSGQTGNYYYVDQTNGNDSYSGTSPATPWKTAAKVNAQTFAPGSQILWKRGEVWREGIGTTGGNPTTWNGTAAAPIVFDAYGSGAKPKFLGSADRSSTGDWTVDAGNVWKTTATFTSDVGNLIFNNEAFGARRYSVKAYLHQQGDFYFGLDNLVYLYSASNPGSFYSHIECAMKTPPGSDPSWVNHIVTVYGESHLVFRNLDFRYGAWIGMHCYGNPSDILTESCDFSWMGGGYIDAASDTTRAGNGWQTWRGGTDLTVRYCTFNQMYDDAIDVEGGDATVDTYKRLRFYYNVIRNAHYGFQFMPRETLAGTVVDSCFWENNTVLNVGGEWSYNQRLNYGDTHVACAAWSSSEMAMGQINYLGSHLYVRNNIFDQGTDNLLYQREWSPQALAAFTLNNNLYWPTNLTDTMIVWDRYNFGGQEHNYAGDQFALFEAQTGKEANGITANPMLNGDYTLQAGSPCMNAGANLGYIRDILGNPILGVPDIGAFEAQGTSQPPAPPVLATATSITANGFTMNWMVSSGATGYRIDVSTNLGFTSFVSGDSALDVGNVLSRAVGGLVVGTTYYTRVRAYNAAGQSGNSNVVQVVTLTPVSFPSGSFSASPLSVVGSGSVTLVWAAQNATTASIDHGIGIVSATGGSLSTPVTTSTTFTLLLSNARGTVSLTAPVTVVPVSTDTTFRLGDSVAVSLDAANSCLNLRSIPSTSGSTILWCMPQGTHGIIIGPSSKDVNNASTYTFWQTRFGAYSGWSRDLYLKKIASSPPPPVVSACDSAFKAGVLVGKASIIPDTIASYSRGYASGKASVDTTASYGRGFNAGKASVVCPPCPPADSVNVYVGNKKQTLR